MTLCLYPSPPRKQPYFEDGSICDFSMGQYVCAYDTYPFFGHPYHFITYVTDKELSYVATRHTFCCLSCLRAYLMSKNNRMADKSLYLFQTIKFYEKYYPEVDTEFIPSVPSRFLLTKYVGKAVGIDIDEFRNGIYRTSYYLYHTPPQMLPCATVDEIVKERVVMKKDVEDQKKLNDQNVLVNIDLTARLMERVARLNGERPVITPIVEPPPAPPRNARERKKRAIGSMGKRTSKKSEVKSTEKSAQTILLMQQLGFMSQ